MLLIFICIVLVLVLVGRIQAANQLQKDLDTLRHNRE